MLENITDEDIKTRAKEVLTILENSKNFTPIQKMTLLSSLREILDTVILKSLSIPEKEEKE